MTSKDIEQGEKVTAKVEQGTESTPLLAKGESKKWDKANVGVLSKMRAFEKSMDDKRHKLQDKFMENTTAAKKGFMSKLGQGASMLFPGTLIGDIVHQYCFKPSYGEHVELAIRAGVAAVIFGIVLLHPRPENAPWGPKGADLMNDVMGSLALVMFFWTLAKTVGGTLYNMWYNVIGQGIATIAIWLMFGFMPGGHHHEWDDPHGQFIFCAGVVIGTLFIMLTLYLNFDTNTKILCLNNFTYFWMLFMDRTRNANSQGFVFDVSGSLWLMLVQCAVGGIIAIMVCAVPYPVMAKDKMRMLAKAVVEDLCACWEELTQTYWIDDVSEDAIESGISVYEFDKLIHDVHSLEAAVIAMEGSLAESWWECFGIGGLEKTRQCLAYLKEAVHKDLDHLPPVLRACAKSRQANQDDPESAKAHGKVGELLMPYITDLLVNVSACLRKCSICACECGPDEDDRADLVILRDNVKKCVDALCDIVCEKRPNTGTSERRLDLGSCDEYTYLFVLSHFGRSTMTLTQQLIDFHDVPQKGRMASIINNFIPYDLFDRSVLTDPDHIKFVIRNSAGILLAFMVGYQGFPNKMLGSNEQLLPQFSYGPAAVLTLMVTKFLGSALTRTLGRITGVILGVVIGMICVGMMINKWYYRALGLGLFTGGSCFMFHNLEVHGGTFVLLGVYGAKVFIMKCPGGCTFEQRKAYCMGQILDCMFALFCMIIIDVIMMAKPASHQAAQQLTDTWDDLCSGTAALFDRSQEKTLFNDGSRRARIEGARVLGLEASQEPRYWKTPFRGFLFNKAIDRMLGIRFGMVCCHYAAAKGGVNGAPKNPIFVELCELQAFKDVGELLAERMAIISRLLPLFSWDKVWRFKELDAPDIIEGGYKEKVDKCLQNLVDEINKARMLADDSPRGGDQGDRNDNTLEKDPICKLSILFLCIDLMLSDMQELQHDILRNN